MKNKVYEDYWELKEQYPKLQIKSEKNNYLIYGIVRIYAKRDNIELLDDFEIEITIQSEYPNALPKIKELSKKIPNGYEHIYNNNNLCLGVDTEILLKFRKNPKLKYWFNEFVVNYFYGVMYYKKYGVIPFGERTHGEKGIIEFYKEYFETDDIYAILRLLVLGKNKKIDRNSYCVCGSKKRTKNCHYSKVYELENINLESDIINIVKYINEEDKKKQVKEKINVQKRLYLEKISRYPYTTTYFTNKVQELFHIK